MDDPTKSPESVNPSSVEVSTEEDKVSAELARAQEAIRDGTATPEDHARVAGFEAGAAAAVEMAKASTPEQTPVATEDINSDDMLGAVLRRIERQQDDITQRSFGEDTTELKRNLQVDLDLRDYLKSRQFKDGDGNTIDPQTGLPKSPEQSEITNQNDKRYFEDESLNNLINKWAEADKNKDRTISTDVQDEILERLIRQPNLTPEHQTQLLDMIRDRMEAKRNALEGDAPETANVVPTENIAEAVSDPVANPVENVVTPVEKPTQETANNVPDPANFVLVGGQAEQAEALAAAQAGKMEQKPDESLTVVETDKPESLTEVKSQNQEIVEKPKDKETEELIFKAGKDKGSLAELVHRAMEIADLDQEERQSAKGIRGILQKVVGAVKYSTIFKAETQRRRGEEIMLAAKAKMVETGRENLSPDEWEEVLGTKVTDQEKVLLSTISEHTFEKGEGFAVRGEEAGVESKEMGDLRQNLKKGVLDYVIAAGAKGLTDEQRAGLLDQYSKNIGASVDKFMETNPGFTKEELNVYADNARQLLERCLATSEHDGSIEQVDSMLDKMRIDIGQVQLGAYNNINTEHMKRTMELAKNLRVGSAISKATFVVSTWVAAGALASGAAAWAGQSGSKNASKALGVTLGGVLGGPVGAGIGLAVGVGVSAIWGRFMGRRRASDNADLAATSAAYSGESGIGEKLSKMSPDAKDVIKYTDATAQLVQYFELKPGINPGEASLDDWQIKANLSSADLAEATASMSRIQSFLDVETEYNINASKIAEAESARGPIAAIFRSQADLNGRALNLFQATNREDFRSERSTMLWSLRTLSDGLKSQYAGVSIELPVINGQETKAPTLVAIEDYLKVQYAEQATATKNNYLEKVKVGIDAAGRKAAITAGVASLFVGLGTAGIRELVSGGTAHTIFDAFQNEPKISHDILPLPGGSVKGGATEIVTGQNFGKSGVEIHGSQAIFTNYKGEHVAVALGAQGQLTPDDINTLNAHEIVVNQVTNGGTQGQIPIEQFAKQSGATEYKTAVWLDNGTVKPDGTEIHAYIEKTANGGIHLAQRGGIATGNGMSVDIVEAAKQGQVYARIVLDDGTAIKIPGVVENGSVVADISPNSPYAALFTSVGGHVQTLAKSWGWTVGDIKSPTGISVSSVLGQDEATVPVNIPGKTVINVFEKIPKAVAAVINAGRTFVGVMPTGTDTVLDKQKPEEQPPVATPAPTVVEGNNAGEALATVNNPGEALVPNDGRGETLVTVQNQPSEALVPTYNNNIPDIAAETTATVVNDQPVAASSQADNSGGGDYGSSSDTTPAIEVSGRGSSAFNIVRNMPFKVTAKGVDRKIKPGMVLDQLGNGSYLIKDVDGQLQTYTKAEMGNWLENGFISLI